MTEASARSLEGRLDLRFAPGPRGTVLAEASRTPPFHLQRLLNLHPEHPRLTTAVVLCSVAGLFAGDRLRLEVEVEAGAAVSMTTPMATRVFAMPAGHAEVETRVHVAAGGYLELLPEPWILCRDAALCQSTYLELEDDALLIYGDVVAFGRTAHGELHAYRSFQQRTELAVAGTPVLIERLALAPGVDVDAPGMLHGASTYGSLLVVCGDERAPQLPDEARRVLAQHPDVRAGASLLHERTGIAVRVLGGSASQVAAALRDVAGTARMLVLQ